jgi:hypothetical protein
MCSMVCLKLYFYLLRAQKYASDYSHIKLLWWRPCVMLHIYYGMEIMSLFPHTEQHFATFCWPMHFVFALFLHD